MIADMQNELRSFTYISNLYKCIANYNLMGHQIGRKVGDMLEILTMGVVYQNNELKRHLNTEGKLEGFTSAGHKVEFGFFKNPKTKDGLFGAIECKCVGVEVTKNSQTASKHIKTLHPNDFFELSFAYDWMQNPVKAKVKLLSISNNVATIEISNTQDNRIQQITLELDDNIKFIVDEIGTFLNTTPHGNMLTEIPNIIRGCKIIKVESITNTSVKFTLWDCLTWPQTIEKAKQASLVAMDLRKKLDGHWGKEEVNPENKSMTFIHVLCEFSHWEEKSRNVIKTCIDHNLVVPDEILIYAFKCFEDHFGTANMLPYISKKKFETNAQVRTVVNNVLNHFENHILFDNEQNCYVTINCENQKLSLNTL